MIVHGGMVVKLFACLCIQMSAILVLLACSVACMHFPRLGQ